MRSILIVEDDPLVRKTLASQLAKKGFEVAVAETGEDGVRAFGEGAPDLVLLDVHLPDIDGLEVLRRIRERNRRAVLLVMTAFDDMKTTVEAIKLGAFEYLVKPLNMTELELAIEKAFQVRALEEKVSYLVEEKRRARSTTSSATKWPAANTRANVLIQGEPGRTRAKAIHPQLNRDERSSSSTARPSGHLLGELFGHKGRLHRRRQRDQGEVRDRRQGHLVPRRGRGRLAQPPEQAPPGHRVAGLHEGRRGEGPQDRGPHHRRHQSEPQGAHREGAVP
jgi:two-component system response regulator AtoC